MGCFFKKNCCCTGLKASTLELTKSVCLFVQLILILEYLILILCLHGFLFLFHHKKCKFYYDSKFAQPLNTYKAAQQIKY